MKLNVIDIQGETHALEDSTSPSVMDVIRMAGLPIEAQCGGSAACATCHVYVDPAWLDRLPKMEPAEDEMLDMAIERTAESRLSCQLPCTAELDGLVVRMAPGSSY